MTFQIGADESRAISLGSVVVSFVQELQFFTSFTSLGWIFFSTLTWLAGCTPPTRCSRTLPLCGAPKVSGHRVQI